MHSHPLQKRMADRMIATSGPHRSLPSSRVLGGSWFSRSLEYWCSSFSDTCAEFASAAKTGIDCTHLNDIFLIDSSVYNLRVCLMKQYGPFPYSMLLCTHRETNTIYLTKF